MLTLPTSSCSLSLSLSFWYVQPSGSFVAGGNSETLYIWDLGHEQCSSRIPTSTDSCVTSLAVSCETSSFLASASALGASPASESFAPSTTGIGGLAGGLLIAGCGDGSIRAYDQVSKLYYFPFIFLCQCTLTYLVVLLMMRLP